MHNMILEPQIHSQMNHDWRIRTPKRSFRTPWLPAYRLDCTQLGDIDFGVVHNSICCIDGYNWTLQNFGVGYLTSFHAHGGTGLEFTFSGNPSVPNLQLGTTWPFIHINPVTLCSDLQSQLLGGEMSGEDNLRFIVTFDENGSQNNECAMMATIIEPGPTHLGSGFAALCGYNTGAAQVGWARQHGANYNEQYDLSGYQSLMIENNGCRGKVLWGSRLGGTWGPHACDKGKWVGHINSGMSSNVAAGTVPYGLDGRRILIGGYSSNLFGSLVVIVKSIELWYQKRISNYDSV